MPWKDNDKETKEDEQKRRIKQLEKEKEDEAERNLPSNYDPFLGWNA